MESRIQFRIDEETKKLAQRSAERRGMTLSDACRDLAEDLAKEQMSINNHESWLLEQVENAYEKMSLGKSEFISNDMANSMMQRKLNKLKSRQKN